MGKLSHATYDMQDCRSIRYGFKIYRDGSLHTRMQARDAQLRRVAPSENFGQTSVPSLTGIFTLWAGTWAAKHHESAAVERASRLSLKVRDEIWLDRQ